jgi:dipeptidyl aminopeptidase/acylaminoacyl peptidase
VFLTAEGASPEGSRPFVDALDLTSGKKTRLFHSEGPVYEYPLAFLSVASRTLLTRRESTEEPPNYFARDLKTNEVRALTSFPHPYPGLVGATRELVRYQRPDGVALTATLHLPPGYSPSSGSLPLIVWAYPREYKSADAAAQVRESPYRFSRVSWGSPLYWLTQGYAIMDDAAMPIVGEGDEEPNDTYVEQLVASAKAAVDEAARRGVADPDRAAIGGHSYGAFMTANLLAHSDVFRAGIARSGAYNRTLTPFGFQSEERTFWEAPETYFTMSPFMHADQIDEPILLVHGEADNNSGTFPIQSQRLFHALKGHGARARLVLLPHESHGYRGRESVLHTLWETNEWLERYVKNAPPRTPTSN